MGRPSKKRSDAFPSKDADDNGKSNSKGSDEHTMLSEKVSVANIGITTCTPTVSESNDALQSLNNVSEDPCITNSPVVLSNQNPSALQPLGGSDDGSQFHSIVSEDTQAVTCANGDVSVSAGHCETSIRKIDNRLPRHDFVVTLFAPRSFFISSNGQYQDYFLAEMGNKVPLDDNQRPSESSPCGCYHCSINHQSNLDNVGNAFMYSSFSTPVTMRWRCACSSSSKCSGIQQTTERMLDGDSSLTGIDKYSSSSSGYALSSSTPHHIQFGIKRDRSSCGGSSSRCVQAMEFSDVGHSCDENIQKHHYRHNDSIEDDDNLVEKNKNNSSTVATDITGKNTPTSTIPKDTQNGHVNDKHNPNITTNNGTNTFSQHLKSTSSTCCSCGVSSNSFLMNIIERRRREKAVSLEMRRYLRMVEEEAMGLYDRDEDSTILTGDLPMCGIQAKETEAQRTEVAVNDYNNDDDNNNDIDNNDDDDDGLGQSLQNSDIGSEERNNMANSSVGSGRVHVGVMRKLQDKNGYDITGDAGALLPVTLSDTCNNFIHTNHHRCASHVTPHNVNMVTINTGPLLNLSVPEWRAMLSTTGNHLRNHENEVTREATVEMERDGDREEEEIMMSLVTDYLSHYGYSDTLKAIICDPRTDGHLTMVHPALDKRKKILKLLNSMRNSVISYDTTKATPMMVDNGNNNNIKKRGRSTPWDILSACHQLGMEATSYDSNKNDHSHMSLHLPALLWLRIWRWWILLLQLKIAQERHLWPNRNFDETLMLRQMEYDESVLPSPIRLAEIVLYHYSIPGDISRVHDKDVGAAQNRMEVSDKYEPNGWRGIGKKRSLYLAAVPFHGREDDEALLFLYIQCLTLLSNFYEGSGYDSSDSLLLLDRDKQVKTPHQQEYNHNSIYSSSKRFWQTKRETSASSGTYTPTYKQEEQHNASDVNPVNVFVSRDGKNQVRNGPTTTVTGNDTPLVLSTTSTRDPKALASTLEFQKEQEFTEYRALRDELNDYLKSQPHITNDNHRQSKGKHNKKENSISRSNSEGHQGLLSTTWTHCQVHDYNRRSILEDIGVWAEYEASAVPKYQQYT